MEIINLTKKFKIDSNEARNVIMLNSINSHNSYIKGCIVHSSYDVVIEDCEAVVAGNASILDTIADYVKTSIKDNKWLIEVKDVIPQWLSDEFSMKTYPSNAMETIRDLLVSDYEVCLEDNTITYHNDIIKDMLKKDRFDIKLTAGKTCEEIVAIYEDIRVSLVDKLVNIFRDAKEIEEKVDTYKDNVDINEETFNMLINDISNATQLYSRMALVNNMVELIKPLYDNLGYTKEKGDE
jgi:hypothetical protein